MPVRLFSKSSERGLFDKKSDAEKRRKAEEKEARQDARADQTEAPQINIDCLRGDPVVHLPPLGPNFPVTFRHPVSIDPGGIHIPLGNPLPQVNEQYRTADDLFYINDDGEVNNHLRN